MARSPLLCVLLILAWIVLQACAAFYAPSPVFDGRLVDSDSYMRLVRVDALMDGGGWYDGTIARSNAPFGETLHWTRPFDLLLAGLAALLRPFLGGEAGLFWAGALISPLLQLATAFAFIWAVRPMVGPSRWLLPGMALVAVFMQPAVFALFALGHADHHSLLLLLFVLTMGATLRAIARSPANGPPLAAGALAGFGLWLAPEFLMVTAICGAGLAWTWVVQGRSRTLQNQRFSAGLALLTAIGLVAEQPLDRIAEVAHDRISILHLAIAVLILLFWSAVAALQRRGLRPIPGAGRLIVLALTALGMGLVLFVIDPTVAAGPLADVDPRIREIWLAHVVEMAPLAPDSLLNAGRFVFYLGLGFFAVPFLAWAVVRERASFAWPAWCLLLIACAVYLPFAVAHLRLAPYAEMVFAMAATGLVERFVIRSGNMANPVRRALVVGLSLGAIILLPLALGRGLMSLAADQSGGPAITAERACDLPALADYLETSPAWSGGNPQTVLAFLDLGPELLYRTRHRVIATPYHRNADGIVASHLMLGAEDAAAAKALMNERGVDLVLLCPASPERAFFAAEGNGTTLYEALTDGRAPIWLDEIVLPENLAGGFRLYHMAR